MWSYRYVTNSINANGDSNKIKIDKARERKYLELRRAIKEMDTWNYTVQTSRDEDYLTANHSNFSALGISRDPSDFNTPYSTRKLATYDLLGGTKPCSCYPRWMANTFSAMKHVEDTVGSLTQQQINSAVDLNMVIFNDGRPNTRQMFIFSNTHSVLRAAQENFEELRNATPQQKLQLLMETRSSSNNDRTVGQEMISTTKSQLSQNAAVLEVMSMNDEDFLALTGMNKARIRAQKRLQITKPRVIYHALTLEIRVGGFILV